MTSSTSTSVSTSTSTAIDAKVRRPYAIFIGITVFFIFLQSLTAGTFIEGGLPNSAKDAWTTAHGLIAYPTMVFALVSAIIAFRGLRSVRLLAPMTGFLFLATVLQWLSGHAITTLGMDWVTPLHVMLAFVIYGLAIYLSVRSAALRKLAQPSAQPTAQPTA